MGGAPATPVLRDQCPRLLHSVCQLVYFQTRPHAGRRASHPHPGRSLIQTQVPLSDKIQAPTTRCFSVYVQLVSRRRGWDMGSESTFLEAGRCGTCLLDIWVCSHCIQLPWRSVMGPASGTHPSQVAWTSLSLPYPGGWILIALQGGRRPAG